MSYVTFTALVTLMVATVLAVAEAPAPCNADAQLVALSLSLPKGFAGSRHTKTGGGKESLALVGELADGGVRKACGVVRSGAAGAVEANVAAWLARVCPACPSTPASRSPFVPRFPIVHGHNGKPVTWANERLHLQDLLPDPAPEDTDALVAAADCATLLLSPRDAARLAATWFVLGNYDIGMKHVRVTDTAVASFDWEKVERAAVWPSLTDAPLVRVCTFASPSLSTDGWGTEDGHAAVVDAATPLNLSTSMGGWKATFPEVYSATAHLRFPSPGAYLSCLNALNVLFRRRARYAHRRMSVARAFSALWVTKAAGPSNGRHCDRPANLTWPMDEVLSNLDGPQVAQLHRAACSSDGDDSTLRLPKWSDDQAAALCTRATILLATQREFAPSSSS
jgi:hypothetical protein